MRQNTRKFKLKYWYLATGMEGVPEEYPEKVIEALTIDEAFYKYHKSNGVDVGTFEEFMNEPMYVRRWATSCEEIGGTVKYTPGKCRVFAKPCIEEYVKTFGEEEGTLRFDVAMVGYKLAIDSQDCFNRIRTSDSVDITQGDLTDESKEVVRHQDLRPTITYNTLHEDSILGAVVRSLLGSDIVLDKNAKIVMNTNTFIKLHWHTSKKYPELLTSGYGTYKFWGTDLCVSSHTDTYSWELHGYNKKGKFLIEKFYDGVSLDKAVKAYDRIVKESMWSRVKRFLGFKTE